MNIKWSRRFSRPRWHGGLRWAMYPLLATFVLLSGAVFRIEGLGVASVAVVLYLLISSSFHVEMEPPPVRSEDGDRFGMPPGRQGAGLFRVQWLLGTYVLVCFLIREHWYSTQLEGLSMAVVIPLTLGAAIAHLWLGILGITQIFAWSRTRLRGLRLLEWLTIGLNLVNWYVLFRGLRWFMHQLA